MVRCRVMLIADHTFSCDGVERVGTVEGYRRDRAGYLDGDCAGHSDGSTFKLQAHWRSRGRVGWGRFVVMIG